jgi:endonuclease-3
LIGRLRKFYGALPQPPSDPFTLFVWEVLSVHSVPHKRDAALASLKRIRALTPDAMWRAPRKKLEESVMLAGPYLEQRLRALHTGVDLFRRHPDLPKVIKGPAAAALKSLKPLPQMGEGGAYRMLLFTAGHATLPVDARLSRTAVRLGYGEKHADFKKMARAVRAAIGSELPSTLDAYRETYLYLSHHGAATCAERDPHCTVCPIAKDCPSSKTPRGGAAS